MALQWALVAIAAASGVTMATAWHVWTWAAYLVPVNLLTFALYAYDKYAAGREWKRIPERSLHLSAAAGGTPAAFIAQSLFRHKTRKHSFRVTFGWIVAGQIAVIAGIVWLKRGFL